MGRASQCESGLEEVDDEGNEIGAPPDPARGSSGAGGTLEVSAAAAPEAVRTDDPKPAGFMPGASARSFVEPEVSSPMNVRKHKLPMRKRRLSVEKLQLPPDQVDGSEESSEHGTSRHSSPFLMRGVGPPLTGASPLVKRPTSLRLDSFGYTQRSSENESPRQVCPSPAPTTMR